MLVKTTFRKMHLKATRIYIYKDHGKGDHHVLKCKANALPPYIEFRPLQFDLKIIVYWLTIFMRFYIYQHYGVVLMPMLHI